MSEEIVFDPAAEDGADFADLLQARCPEMQVLTGTVGSTSSRERSHSEIQIVIPGERAVAEIVYRTPEGSVRRQGLSERQISIIPAGQPHQLLCARGTDLTVVRITSDLLKRIARESGMRAVEVVGQYGTFDPVIWHLGRAVRAELRRHRQLDGTYLQSVAMVLSRQLLSTRCHGSPSSRAGDCLASSCDVRSSTYTSTWRATSVFAMSPLMCG